MSKRKIITDFTRGNIPKQMFKFMLPFMVSNAMQVLYSTVDMVIVGKYVGTAGISAVSLSSLILNFATMVCLGFSNAGQILVSQALGAQKKKDVNDIIGTLFTVILSMGVLFSGNMDFARVGRILPYYIRLAERKGADIELLLHSDNNNLTILDGDGDFRSEESIEYLKESDIVVTNPPFSLFREYVAQLMEYEKKFLIIGNI